MLFLQFVLPDVQTLLQYFNYAVIGIVALFALFGFIRGTYKSIYYMIATAIIFGGGWFAMGVAVDFIMNFDLSSYNLVIMEVPLNSVGQFVTDMIISNVPQFAPLMTTDTLFYELVMSLVTMVVGIVYIIIIVVFAFTIFKFIFDFLWLFFRPKKRNAAGKRVKKSFLSRLGGLGIGAAKGVFYVLLITFPLAGIASIVNSIGEVLIENPEDMSYQLVFVGESATLVQTSEPGIFEGLGEFSQIFELMGLYRETLAGQIFGTIALDDTAGIDEYLFDGIFSFEVNEETVALRSELAIIASAISKADGLLESGFSFEALMAQDPDTLRDIIDDIASLKIIKVAIPVALEVVLLMEDAEGMTLLDQLPGDIELNWQQIRETNYANDVQNLGYIFVDVTTLFDFSDGMPEIDPLVLDGDIVQSIFENLGELEIIDTFAPIAISYLTTMETIETSLSELGLSIDDLGLDQIEDWGAEISQIGVIYNAFSQLQIQAFDETETFEFVTEEKVTALSTALFDSVLISNAVPVLVGVLSDSLMPEEYRDLLVFEEGIWDAQEFSALINAAVVIIKSDILAGGQDAFLTLDNDTIDDLAKYLSRSRFLTGNLNVIIENVMGSMELFGADVELVMLEPEEWTELELRSIFRAVRVIVSEGTENLTNISDETIDDLAYNLARSKFITSNIEGLINTALSSIELGEDIELGTFDGWEDVDAAQLEFTSIFKSAKIITNKGSDMDAFLSLTDEELDTFLNSRIISGTLVNILKSYSGEGNPLEFLVGVDDETIEWYDTFYTQTTFTIDGTMMTINPVENATKYDICADDVKVASTRLLTFDLSTLTLDPDADPTYTVFGFQEGELRKIFLAINSLASSLTGEEGFSTDTITQLTDDEIDNILISDILVLSIIQFIEDMAAEPDSFIIIPEGPLKDENQTIKLNAWKDQIVEGTTVEGELSKIFKGLRILLDGTEIENFTTDTITDLTDDDIYILLKSDILTESIIAQIEKLSDDVDSIISIPADVGLDDPDDRSAWKNVYRMDANGAYVYDEFDKIIVDEDGELTRCLRALRLVLSGGSIEDIDIGSFMDENNREIILASMIVEETIIHKIESLANEENAIIVIPNNIKNDRTLWFGQNGELRKVINALDYVLGEDASLDNFDFDISAVLEAKDEVLKSEVICETIIAKLDEQSEIHIPLGTGYGLNDPDDRSPWHNVYQLDVDGNYEYDEFDQVIVVSYGELSRLLDAIDIIIPADPITGERSLDNITFDLSELLNPDNQEIFLRSLVLSETVVQKIYEVADDGNNIYIPVAYLNAIDDSSAFNRDKWFSDYSGPTPVKGEVAFLLEAADLIMGEGDTFESFSFDLSVAYDEGNQIALLRSKVISETIVQKIYEESIKVDPIIKMPTTLYVNDVANDDSRDKWFNTYDDEGDLVSSGEIARMLAAVEFLLGGGSFENISFDMSAAFDEANQETILKSYVISETMINIIVKEEGKGNLNLPSALYLNDVTTDDSRDKWYNSYEDDVLVKGELAYLLAAADKLIGEGESFEDLNFDLSAAYDEENQVAILRSKVISETIVQKIYEESIKVDPIIKMPTTLYVNDVANDDSRDKWFNTYDDEGNLISSGEISRMLAAVEFLLGGGSFENISFDMSAAFDSANQETILKSYVISETMINIIVKEEGKGNLNLPSALYLNDVTTDDSRDKWYNSYEDDVLVKGELAYLLAAADKLIGEGESFEDLNFDLSAAYDEENQVIILRSKVISETIVQKIYEESIKVDPIIKMPTTLYVNDVANDDSRDKWFNTYDDEGDLVSSGEISRMLAAVEFLLGGGSFENISFDMSAAFDSANQETILKSYVISETMINIIVKEEGKGNLNLPSALYLNDVTTDDSRDLWYNSYEDDVLVKGELAYLLAAADKLIGEGESFENLNFDLSAAYDEENQVIILRSKVISETIVQKIYEESTKVDAIIKMPTTLYVNDVANDDSRDKWFNTYDETDALVETAEIARLLAAAQHLLGGGSFENVTFDMSAAFDPITQEVILKSYVISETMVHMIVKEADGGNLSLPSADYINDIDTDQSRNKWFNRYADETLIKGELAFLLGAANELIPEGGSFEGMNFDLSAAYEDESQVIILRSKVISETIVQKIYEESNKVDAVIHMPTSEYVNDVSMDTNRDKWYSVYDASGALVSTAEVARLLSAAKHLLGGGNFENVTFDMSAAFNDVTQEVILKSYVISETMVHMIVKEADGGNLSLPSADYINDIDNDDLRDKWYNRYVGETLIKGELAFLLGAANELIPEGGSFEGMNFDLSAAYEDESQVIILRSKVISETIVQKIYEESTKPGAVLHMPTTNYVNDVSMDTNRDKWYSVYDASGALVSTAEVARLLSAAKHLLGGGDFENVTFDMSAAFNDVTQETILKSFVISETMVHMIIDESSSGNLSIPSADYVNDVDNDDLRDKWYNRYVGETLIKGELAFLLGAANELIPEGGSFEGMNFDLSAAYEDESQVVILRSKVISETIVQKIYDESTKPGAVLHMPTTNYVNDVSMDTNRDKWYSVYDASGALVSTAEVARLLSAAKHLLGGGSFENISFDMSAAFDPITQETILKSFVISETMVHMIIDESSSGNLSIPSADYVNDIDVDDTRDQWYNRYVDEDLVKGELANLLSAAKEILPEGGSFEGMNFDLSAAYEDESQVVILRSKVISETIVQKIYDESTKPGAVLHMPTSDYVNDVSLDNLREKWFSAYDVSGNLVSTAEIARLLSACKYLLGGGSFENISFDMSAAFDPLTQETILKSFVISETMVHMIIDESTSGNLSLPSANYVNDVDVDDTRDKWFNRYVDEDLVKGELAYLLSAAKEILPEGGSFEGMNFDLSAAYEDESQVVILRSKVISETIVQKIYDESTKPGAVLHLPTTNYVNDVSMDDWRDKWYNAYDASGALTSTAEIARLLSACKYLLGGGSFENISFDMSAAFDPLTQETILKSFVISETMVYMIIDESTSGNLELPSAHYVNDVDVDDTRDKWFNRYVDEDLVKGELAYLLSAAKEILPEGGSFEGMNFDLSAAYEDESQVVILRSKVISETIVQKVVDESNNPLSTLSIPSSDYVNDVSMDDWRDKWFSSYNVSGALVSTAELARLLSACKYLLGGGDFANISFDMSAAFDPLTQETILKSYVISETMVNLVHDEASSGIIVIPSTNYVNDISTDDLRDKWFNRYVDDVLVKGELAYLLSAADVLIPEGGDFGGMDFALDNLFEAEAQKTVLRSFVFSETIISKIFEQDGVVIDVPVNDLQSNSMSDADDRYPWFNQYSGNDVSFYGEISKMLNATNTILGGSGTFATMEFDINALFNEAKKAVVLQSLVLSETIVQKIFANTTAISDIPEEDLVGRPLEDDTDRLGWYNHYNGGLLIEENELDKFLRAINLIVGDEGSFEALGAITIDSLLDLVFEITLDVDLYVETSDFATLVNSVVLENIIAPLVNDVATVIMVSYLVVPDGGYNWLKKDLITEYDLETFEEDIYDLESFLESLYLMNDAGIDYTDLGSTPLQSLDEPTIQKLAIAMVVSRTYKGSIAKMYNEILYPTYASMPATIGPATKKSWDDVKFIQTDYDGTRVQARDNLVAKLISLTETEIVTFMGFDFEVPTAFYDYD